MTTYTITTEQNIDELTGKTGFDPYIVDGGTLIIDQDTRYGLNQNTSSVLITTTISATLGGILRFDARKVRLIPFDSGTGNVPASNTVISQGDASGKLIGVWSSLTVAPTASGAAMPATGFLKIKQWNDEAYASGALTGIGANATGADIVGWLEIVGNEQALCTIPRLGLLEMLGEWYTLGDTNGSANQQFQIPTNGSLTYVPGIYVEKTADSEDYEFYPCAGSQTTVATDVRAKVCWISSAGLVRIGHNGTANAGYVPASGLKVVVPNLICQNAASANKTLNVAPHGTLGNRYEFATTQGGTVIMRKVAFAWYLNFNQAYSVELTDVAVLEQILVKELATELIWTRVGVGLSANHTFNALLMSQCYAGGTFTDCTWSRSNLPVANACTVSLTDVVGFTFLRNTTIAMTARSTPIVGGLLATNAKNCTWISPKIVNGEFRFNTCSDITLLDPSYCDTIAVNALGVNPMRVASVALGTTNFLMSGCDFMGLTNVQPYAALFSVYPAGCSGIKLRNIGTRSAPFDLGSSNACALLFECTADAAGRDIRVQRCYVTNTRLNLWSADNSNSEVLVENCAGDYADAPVSVWLNGNHRGVGCSHAMTAQTAVYGTHWADIFTSATAGRVVLLMNEKTQVQASQSSYTDLVGTTRFTGAGGLYMPTVDDAIDFEMPYYALGHTGFAIALPTMGGGTLANYDLHYQLDVRDGTGFGALRNLRYGRAGGAGTSGEVTFDVTDATGVEVDDYAFGTGVGVNARVVSISTNTITVDVANAATVSGVIAFNHLPGESSVSDALGFKLRIKITATTASAAAITNLYVPTTTTAASQDIQYTLDPFVSAGVILANAPLVGDGGYYRMFFTALPGTGDDYGEGGAITVNDNDGNPITGEIDESEIQFTFDYYGNSQGGRTPGTDAPVTVVAVRPDGSKPVIATGTITLSESISISLVAEQDRAYV